MAWFNNRYVCPECKSNWEDEWSAKCDDTCPVCQCSNVSPVSSDDLSVTVCRNNEGEYVLLVSSDNAEDHAAYFELLKIPEVFIRSAAQNRQFGLA